MSIDHGAAPRILTVFLILLAGSVASAIDLGLTGVPTANPKAPGLSTPNVLSPELIQTIVAQGSMPLENATGVYGFMATALTVQCCRCRARFKPLE